jgi:hypothetical protein
MSLKTTSLVETVKKQYFYKLKANIDSFSSLVGIQLLALIFSFGGVGSSGMGGGDISVNVKHYSSDIVLLFTFIWAFVTAITITTRPYRNHDFSYVTNRLSSSLSNLLFLGTTSILGGLTAMLSGNLLQVFTSLFSNEHIYQFNNGGQHFILGITAIFFYLVLVSSLGYFVGTLVQVNKLFIIVIPVLLIGILFLEGSTFRQPILSNVFQFYVMESSFILFIVKAVLTSVTLLTLAISILNRLEVRR